MTTSKAVEAIPRGGGYQVESSFRFNKLPYFSYAPASSGTKVKWTLSCWIRPGYPATQAILNAGNNDTYRTCIWLWDTGRINFYCRSNTSIGQLVTQEKLLDPSAYTHIVASYDANNATESERMILWVNGVRVTEFDTFNPLPRYTWSRVHIVGDTMQIGEEQSKGRYLVSLVSQICLIENAVLTAASFGEWHPRCPQVWRPIDISGLDFSNSLSFLLTFDDATSATTLGYDSSGNNNHWTPNSVGTYYKRIDSPTNTITAWNQLENFNARWNLSVVNTHVIKLTDNGAWKAIRGDQFYSTGKIYFEIWINRGTDGINYVRFGFGTRSADLELHIGRAGSWCINNAAVGVWNAYSETDSHTISAGWSDLVSGEIIQIAIDLDAKKAWFGINGVWDGDPSAGTNPTFSNLPDASLAMMYASYGIVAKTQLYNDNFIYPVPTGFQRSSCKNLTTPAIKDPKEYFVPYAYTGNAVDGRHIDTGNIADHVVVKKRDAIDSWYVWDNVRNGKDDWPNNLLNWDLPEDENSLYYIRGAFSDLTGFRLGPGEDVNKLSSAFIAYAFTKSPIAGMDIVAYSGNGVGNTQVSHSLGVKPSMIWVKNLTTYGYEWRVYEGAYNGATHYLALDTPASAQPDISAWNNTEPTASNFTLGGMWGVNKSGEDYIAYLFASVEGFSKVFTYEGNGNADGPFVYCGFKPAFILLKNVNSSTQNWRVYDIARSTYNPVTISLRADTNAAEVSDRGVIDFNANGFKIRNATYPNRSGDQYVGIAFAEYPFALQGGQ